jgi:hypothetical protein
MVRLFGNYSSGLGRCQDMSRSGRRKEEGEDPKMNTLIVKSATDTGKRPVPATVRS